MSKSQPASLPMRGGGLPRSSPPAPSRDTTSNLPARPDGSHRPPDATPVQRSGANVPSNPSRPNPAASTASMIESDPQTEGSMPVIARGDTVATRGPLPQPAPVRNRGALPVRTGRWTAA